MQANQATLMWTMIICSVVLLASVFFIGSQIPETPEFTMPVIPSAAEIATAVSAGIVIPQAPQEAGNYDAILNEICDTEGVDCEGTYVSTSFSRELGDIIFHNEFPVGTINGTNTTYNDLLELLDLDEDYFINIRFRKYDEYEASVENKEARDDGDYTIQQLIRVNYRDEDYPDDTETMYYLITSEVEGYNNLTYDSSDFDFVSVEESTRNFEF